MGLNSAQAGLLGALGGALLGVFGTLGAVFLTPVADDWWEQRKEFKYEMARPRPGEDVSQKRGFRASGTTSNLKKGESLWILDRDNEGFYIAEEATIEDGNWKAISAPLGDSSTKLPVEQQFVLVKATADCSDALRNSFDDFIATLPRGCTILETRFVDVTKK